MIEVEEKKLSATRASFLRTPFPFIFLLKKQILKLGGFYEH